MKEPIASRGIPGANIVLAGEEYVLAPITLTQFMELEDDFNRLFNSEELIQGGERFKIIAKFVLASLRRNYEVVRIDNKIVAISEAVMFDILDFGNRETAFQATLAISGLVPLAETAEAKES